MKRQSKPTPDTVTVPRAVLATFLDATAKHWQPAPREYAILVAAVKK